MFRRRETLKQKVERKDVALDAAIKALTRLSKKGSLTKELREQTLQLLVLARNERLPVDVEPVVQKRGGYQPEYKGPAPTAPPGTVQCKMWDEE